MLEYILLGIIQGLTEPIPVSSSGHLKLFQHLFKMNAFKDLNFEIITNFGSLIAILIIFRKDIIKIVKGFFTYLFKKDKESYPSFKYALQIVVASIPVGLFGFLFKDKIASFGNMTTLGIAFIITAISLFLVKDMKGTKSINDISYKDSIIIGLFQLIALFPGISRSGMTLVGCLFRDLKREDALKFTFMLYIPVSLASFLLGIFDIFNAGQISSILMPYTVGLILSLLGTLVSYKWLSNIVKKGKLVIFAIYCLILSGIIFIMF